MSNAAEDLQFFLNGYKATNEKVRSGLATSIAKEDYSDEVELLKKSNVLTLIFFGNDEKVVQPYYLDNAEINLWKNTIFKIEGASHYSEY